MGNRAGCGVEEPPTASRGAGGHGWQKGRWQTQDDGENLFLHIKQTNQRNPPLSQTSQPSTHPQKHGDGAAPTPAASSSGSRNARRGETRAPAVTAARSAPPPGQAQGSSGEMDFSLLGLWKMQKCLQMSFARVATSCQAPCPGTR